ncbi:16S rRNA (adenine(1518)-N(6)/adenine(1519)-N(6))-dimethyltransferase RsmA [Algimonas porphyrae]|uniref:Ribosomal RNA small subunit methyltransferase A n=1 Tax=Algimonas porphyrae TaxID=1128113 RepID=A0ABQ5UXA6_9PROT|nr:16S rRNA (adenine(1518)-N(6)/adenine(1519)-N(6))-dimethyltransferase RsmA [Algimonas porphyrae]GLQ19916.1 ribosomal RNA small subunit methyltransferase A [Algimonas porphyrae]
MTTLSALPSLHETVNIHGLRADKSLGQHFLLDLNLTRSIARLARPLDGVQVAEVGPGPGGLTRALILEGADHVHAIEMDTRFFPPLDDIAQASGRLTVHHADALRFDMANSLSSPRKIVANLPYNVGTKMLTNWMTASPRFWTQLVLMFQLEVAERVCAQPGENAYGRLAILCQSVGDCRIAMEVPARLFTPPPKVDSAVVVIDPLETPYPHLDQLARVTQAAFGQRRKMLRRSLRSLAQQTNLSLEAWLDEAGIDPQARPETLPITAFQTLADRLVATDSASGT